MRCWWSTPGRARAPTRAGTLALGVLIAAAILTRTIGVALLVAVVLAEIMRQRHERDAARLRSLAWTCAVPIVAVALWYLLRPSAGEDAYATFGSRVAADASGQGLAWILSMLEVNASALADAWLGALLIFWGEWWKPGFLLAAALGALGGIATLWRAIRGEMDAIYCFVFVAILLAWPFPGQMFRLAFPIFPLVVVNLLWAWQRLLSRPAWPAGASRAPYAAVLPLVLCIPAVLFYVFERARAPDAEGPGLRKADIAEFYRMPSGPGASANALAQIAVMGDMERIRESTPEGARIMWYVPAYIALLARRQGVPLERPRDAADFAAQARATGADYLYVAAIHPRDSARRLGNPLDALAMAKPYVQVAWHRDDRAGGLQSALLKIDRSRIASEPVKP